MTKDEAISLQSRIQSALDLLADATLPRDTWRDVSNVLHACRDAVRATPTSDAVAASGTLDDRNAASPAATDEQQGNAIRPSAEPAGQLESAAGGAWQRLLDAAKESIRLHDEVTGGYDYGYISLDLRFAIEAVEAEKVAQTGMAGAAKGGITMNALREWENMPWAKPAAAQPAADPTPVPAQTGTIDTPEFKALLVECHYNVIRADKWGPLIAHIEAHLAAQSAFSADAAAAPTDKPPHGACYFPHKVVVPEGLMVVMENGKVIDPAALEVSASPVPLASGVSNNGMEKL